VNVPSPSLRNSSQGWNDMRDSFATNRSTSPSLSKSPQQALEVGWKLSRPAALVTSSKVQSPRFLSGEFGCFPDSPSQAPRIT